MRRQTGWLIVVLLATLGLAACNSSSRHVGFSGSTISGTLSDGYVAGATLTVYASADLTSANVIGTGTTAADGSFSFTLATLAPATIYIKAEGGTDISTGLSAPVMFFAGTAGSAGDYNISPLTDAVWKYAQTKGGLDEAEAFINTALGLDAADGVLWLDPVLDPTAAAAMNRVLAAGTQTSSLKPGTYDLDLVFFTRRNLDLGTDDDQPATVTNIAALETRVVRLPITLGTDMAIDTTVLAAANINFDNYTTADHLYIAGGVTGSSLFLAIDVNDPDDEMAAGSYVFMLSGEVGPFGSLAGSCQVRTNGGSSVLYQGLFAGAITPQGLTAAQADAMYAQLAATVASTEPAYLMFSDLLLPSATVPSIRHGEIVLTANAAIGFNYTGLDADAIAYNGSYDGLGAPTNLWTAGTGAFNYLSGPFGKSRLLALNEGDYFLILPAGGRRGLYVHKTGAHVVDRVGQLNLTRSDALAPVLEAGATYRLASAGIGKFLVGQERAAAQQAVVAAALLNADAADDPSLTVPAGSRGSGYDATNGIYAVSGAFMAYYLNNDADFNDGPAAGGNDHLLSFEMYESGALTGMRLAGGQATIAEWGGAVDLFDTPFNAVMFAQKSGSTAPGVKATFKFLAREIVGGAVVDTIPVSSVGTLMLDIDAGAATGSGLLRITAIDGSGYNEDDPAENAPAATTLVVERISATGLLHCYGTGTYTIYYSGQPNDVRDYYWDIYWPVGSPKAAYFFSFKNDADTQFIVNEVGEAYVSY